MELTQTERDSLIEELAKMIVDSLDIEQVLQMCRDMAEADLCNMDDEDLLAEYEEFHGKPYEGYHDC